MKSQTDTYFNSWLDLMETAYWRLSPENFQELEERIKKEIAFHRKRKIKHELGEPITERCKHCGLHVMYWERFPSCESKSAAMRISKQVKG